MKQRGGILGWFGRGDSPARDAVLLALFAAVVAWSLFFTVVRPGAAAPGGPSAAAGRAGEYRGELTIRVTSLPESAWHNIKVGDRMGTAARVAGTAVKEYSMGRREIHVTLAVTGPIQFVTMRWPFPQAAMPLRVGSHVWFETDRYSFIGDVIAKNP